MVAFKAALVPRLSLPPTIHLWSLTIRKKAGSEAKKQLVNQIP